MEKYSGCGNTFYITTYDEKIDNSESIKKICKNDVDGLIMVKTNPLTFHMYNRDGSIANMCGNGIRCFIHYCYNHKVITEMENDVNTIPGIYKTVITSTNPFNVKVKMVKPNFTFVDGKKHLNEAININGTNYSVSLVNTGVWHVIVPFYSDHDYQNALAIAKDFYDYYDGLYNINFVKVKNGEVRLRTFEHGVDDFTLACGTGSVATFVILKKLGVINDNSCDIINNGGTLTISYEDNDYYMAGKSEIIE